MDAKRKKKSSDTTKISYLYSKLSSYSRQKLSDVKEIKSWSFPRIFLRLASKITDVRRKKIIGNNQDILF